MLDLLNKLFPINFDQKILDQYTPEGQIEIYHASDFGLLLVLNGELLLAEYDHHFFNEMMTHTALFTHPSPKRILVLGNNFGLAQEAAKHTHIKEIMCIHSAPALENIYQQYFEKHLAPNPIINIIEAEPLTWLLQNPSQQFDVILQTNRMDEGAHTVFCSALTDEGILSYPIPSIYLYQNALKQFYPPQGSNVKNWQLLNFPQPTSPFGIRTLVMMNKSTAFKRIREKEIFNRPFTTRFYNHDMHKAALVLPEFLAEELITSAFMQQASASSKHATQNPVALEK